jgi:hypothetical protein
MSFRRRRVLLCLLAAALVAPVAAARAIRADGTPSAPAQALSAATMRALRLDPASVRTLGAYPGRSGGRFDVLYGRRAGGAECLITVGYGSTGAGCGGLFARGPVAILEGATGGPALDRRSDMEVAGWARANVARVAVVDTAGRWRWPGLNENNAFLLEFTQAELQARVGPAELVAFDKSGAEVMRLDLAEPDS